MAPNRCVRYQNCLQKSLEINKIILFFFFRKTKAFCSPFQRLAEIPALLLQMGIFVVLELYACFYIGDPLWGESLGRVKPMFFLIKKTLLGLQECMFK